LWQFLFGRAIRYSFPYIHVPIKVNVIKIVNVMSKMSAKTRYEAFMEWHKWAQHKYPIMKKKKKARPDYMTYGAQNDY
jgi:hypothetical protein